jgi:hypothetical protein
VTDPVKLFEEAVAALNRVDFDAMRELVDPQIAFLPLRSAVTGAYIGWAGIEAFVAENEARFDVFSAEYDELRALDEHRVLAVGYIRMRGKGSDEETRYKTAGIATFREGRMASWHDYGSEAAALKAAGVS